jgi:hypothetical protein
MSLAPTYEAIRRETSVKPLMRKNPAEVLGIGHQCKDGYCHQLSVIFESVEISIRRVGLYLGVISNLYPCFKHSMVLEEFVFHTRPYSNASVGRATG